MDSNRKSINKIVATIIILILVIIVLICQIFSLFGFKTPLTFKLVNKNSSLIKTCAVET